MSDRWESAYYRHFYGPHRALDVREKLSGLGADPVGSTPEQFAAFIQTETKKWARVIREGNVKAE